MVFCAAENTAFCLASEKKERCRGLPSSANSVAPVTVRERDAMTQERIGIDGVLDYLAKRLAGC